MANEYFHRTPTSSGNRKIFTYAGWFKKNYANGSDRFDIFNAYNTGSQAEEIGFRQDALRYLSSGSSLYGFDTTNKYRDTGSWFHVVFALNTTLESQRKRSVVYINGVEVDTTTSSGIGAYVAKNFDSIAFNVAGKEHNVLARKYSSSGRDYLEGGGFDIFFVDGQALTPDVFGFFKEGKGYQSSGTTQATDFRPGQWSPHSPRKIKTEIERKGGFGVNGFYLPMNDSSNFGADFHMTPNSIIKLKGEDLPQPRNGAPTTSDSYVSQLRSDPYAANLVLAIPGITGGQGSGVGDYSADIKGSGSNKTVTANGNAGIAATASYYGSAMQFDGNGDYLEVANSSDFDFGNGDFTIEFWTSIVSFGTPGSGIWDASNNQRSWLVYLNSSSLPRFFVSTDGSSSVSVVASNPTIPNNQWTHLCMERNGPNLVGYVNGVCVGINTNLGTQSLFTPADPLWIGRWDGNPYYTNGYIQDFRVYKGVAKYKGGFDVSKPYTPVGIESWRQVPDTCKNNFATLNAVDYNSSTTALSDGNLTLNATSNNGSVYSATYNVPNSGKYYFEFYEKVIDATTTNYISIVSASDDSKYQQYRGYGYIYTDGVQATGYATMDEGDLIGVGIDADLGKVSFYNNGTLIATVTSSSADYVRDAKIRSYLPRGAGSYPPGDTRVFNFGQNPTFSGSLTAGTYTDSNGKGLFKYQPPAGYLALCEDNLPTPAIADPGDHFKTVLWTGDGNSGRSITGVGFKPDLVWLKKRNDTPSHNWTDSVRGIGYTLFSDDTSADNTNTARLQSFDNDGFTVGNHTAVNNSGDTFVAWCWKAGGAAVSNSDGSITSQVSANQTAGFSIVSYTGNGTSGTVGHGLGKIPNIVLCKNRIDSSNWSFNGNIGGLVYGTNKLMLQTTGAIASDTNEVTSVNATTFTLGNSGATNGSSDAQIAYCWTEIEGYSKFGSYEGNGNADGPFIYCGFKPAFVLIKTTAGGSWVIKDSSRNATNPNGSQLYANTSAVDDDPYGITDFLSNGFKPRVISQSVNASGETYIFMAFAESPFQTANAK